jgi:hypothetical protein
MNICSYQILMNNHWLSYPSVLFLKAFYSKVYYASVFDLVEGILTAGLFVDGLEF